MCVHVCERVSLNLKTQHDYQQHNIESDRSKQLTGSKRDDGGHYEQGPVEEWEE